MELRLLGPLELVGEDGVPIGVGARKERALLAVLAVHANQPVSEDRLVAALWDDVPPRTAVRTLQSYLSRLRKVLAAAAPAGEARLESTGGGWMLHLKPGVTDVSRVAALVEAGRAAAAAGDHVGAALAFSDGLRAWRGAPFHDFADQPWAAIEAGRLEEIRQAIAEQRVDAELACGRHAELIGELEATCRAHPLRERPWGQRMIALYRSGRQAEALRVYQELRRTLVEELGLEPSPALSRLERDILVHDAALQWQPAGQAQRTQPAPQRVAIGTTNGVVTLLFTDMVGSTELLDRLGDDSYEAVRRGHFQMLREAVSKGGGTEVKNLGDGLMAVFASAVDGLGCAMAIQQAVARRNRRDRDGRFGVRVGLHIGEPIRDEADYFGTPVVVAKRLCDAAEPGQILASQLVADLVGSRGGFEFAELRSLDLKGIASPVAACTVKWGEQASRPFPAALAAMRETAFVGRETEIAELEAAWRRSQDGRRQVVLVAGEPGIGKTTLAVRVAETAWGQGAVTLFGRCDEESVVAFQPFVQAIAHYAETTRPDELRAQLGAQAADLALLLPGLARRLPELEGVAGTGAETERYRIFEAVVALFAAIGADAPVVLVLDDLHWADRPTLQLLQHLIRRSAEVPLLMLGTYRDTDLVRTHPTAETLADLRRANLVTRVPLRGLSAEDVAALVTAGQPARPADTELAEALWAETEGSPLFLREILRHLGETGAIVRDQDGRWVACRRVDQLGIPEGVKEVIGRRLTRLSEAANTALRTGSVLGRQVRLDVLERVTDLSTDQLLDALDEATAAGVVDELPGGQGRWAFTHALVRQALYEELSLTRRVRLHQRVGEALEALEPDDGPHLAELAFHFSQAAVAGGADKAIAYARRAGRYALTLAGYEQAARHFAMAVEVAEDAGAGAALRADLLLEQGDAEWRAGDARVARATFEQVVALVVGADPERLAKAALGYAGADVRPLWVEMYVVNERVIGLLEAALAALPDGDSELRARLLACLAQELYFLAGSEARREELSATAVAMARRLDDPATIALVLSARNLAVVGPDHASELIANASEMLALAHALKDRQIEAHALRFRFAAYCPLEDMPAAFADFDRWEALIAELKDPVAQGVDKWIRGCLATLEGRFEDAEALLVEGFRLGHEALDRNAFGAFGTTVGLLRIYQGRQAEVISPLIAATEVYPSAQGLADAIMTGALAELGMHAEARAYLDKIDPADILVLPRNLGWLIAMGMVARACYRLEEGAKAETVYRLLVPFADYSGLASTMGLGSVHLPLAWMAVTGGRLEAAERHFEAALAANKSQGWRPCVAETQVHYARMLAERGAGSDGERALQLLDEAVATAAELGMPVVGREARELRESLFGLSGGSAPPGGGRIRRTVTRRDRARAKVTARGRAAVARWTRGDPDDELIRRFAPNLAQRTLFSAMTRSFQPAMAMGFTGDLVFELRPPEDELDPAAADWWTVEIRGRKATAHRGRGDQPSVTIHVGLANFVRLASGELHPVRALIENTITVEGDVMIAARLPDMFGAVEPLEGLARSGTFS